VIQTEKDQSWRVTVTLPRGRRLHLNRDESRRNGSNLADQAGPGLPFRAPQQCIWVRTQEGEGVRKKETRKKKLRFCCSLLPQLVRCTTQGILEVRSVDRGHLIRKPCPKVPRFHFDSHFCVLAWMMEMWN
jgi:hypothetical protein